MTRALPSLMVALLTVAAPASAQTMSAADAFFRTAASAAPVSRVLSYPARLTLERPVALSTALRMLDEHSGVSLAFSPSLLPADHRATCACESATVQQALDQLLAGTPLGYAEAGAQVLIEPRDRQRIRSKFVLDAAPPRAAPSPRRRAARWSASSPARSWRPGASVPSPLPRSRWSAPGPGP